jgi:hypothetical protein
VIAYFILGVSLLIGFIFLSRWFVATEPRRVAVAARWIALLVAVVVGGYLIWAGRQALAVFLLPLLLPILLRSRALWNRAKAAAGPSPGQTSQVETRFLRMTLDHDSGVMTGVVREGALRGRRLDELDQDEMLELWRECRAEDAQSAAVLEAYLDRTQGEGWRQAAGAGPGPGSGSESKSKSGPRGAATGMTRQEAYEILGLAPGASKKDIRAAHRRLMQQMHPDHGGSNYLAAKINQAKDLLLGG